MTDDEKRIRIASAAMRAANKAQADGDWVLAYRMFSIAFTSAEVDLAGHSSLQMFRQLLHGYARKAAESRRSDQGEPDR